MDYVLGVDVGGTTIKAALFGPGEHPPQELHVHRRSTGREGGPAQVLRNLMHFVVETVEVGRTRYGRDPLAVTVATLGLVDQRTGTAVSSSSVGWRNVPLRDLLQDRITAPVTLTHDIAAAAVAEGTTGAARSQDDFLFIALGTGIGGAVGSGGRLHHGAHGFAGEIGHIQVRPGGRGCGCGGRGCLETVSSGPAIAQRYAELGGDPCYTAADVAHALDMGDQRAVQAWQEGVQGLAYALHVYAAIMDPAVVVVGGGLSLSGELLLAPLREHLDLLCAVRAAPDVLLAKLGDRAAYTGAGILAWRAVSDRETGDGE